MMNSLGAWLGRLLLVLKVWGLRVFYRVSNALSWRGQDRGAGHTDIRIPTGEGDIAARVYPGATGDRQPLIVYIHGGGWVIGDLLTHDPFCRALSRETGCSVVALDYRLAPEHPFPAGQNDCVAAVHWLATQGAGLAPCDGRLIIAGDSAGGNLATCTCLELEETARKTVLGEALIYPATDHYSAGFASYIEKATGQLLSSALVTWFWDTYLANRGSDDSATQRAFPRRSARLSSLPATLLITAENDPLRDEGRAYGEQLAALGVEVSYHHFGGAAHGFACSDGPSPDHRQFMNQFNTWLQGLG